MRAVEDTTSGALHLGDCVTWRAWHFGIPWAMTSRIVEVDRPRRFVDEMQRGPFAAWRHTHELDPIPHGTVIRDTVRYEVPLGILGRIFNGVLLERYLVSLLAGRNRRFKRLVERQAVNERTI